MMRGLSRYLMTFGFLALGICTPLASAQEHRMETVAVTGSRISESIPGVVLKRQGDFLLLDVVVESDSREFSLRKQEIEATVENLLTQAKNESSITVSIDANGLIYPLESSEDLPIYSGSRPDTSRTSLILRTPIPQNIQNIQELVTRLQVFGNNVEEVGRAAISATGDPAVSVVNPEQYRMDVIETVLEEIDMVTRELGTNYRVVITGLDRRMQWRGTDATNVIFYIPYSYSIIPTSLNTAWPDY